MKVNKKYLKDLVINRIAEDITYLSFEKAEELRKKEELQEMGISCGKYGMNGALFKGKSGKLYAICSRSSTLFQLV